MFLLRGEVLREGGFNRRLRRYTQISLVVLAAVVLGGCASTDEKAVVIPTPRVRYADPELNAKTAKSAKEGPPKGGTTYVPGAQLSINLGTTANDGTGDSLRTFAGKTQTNFTELYTNVRNLSNTVAGLSLGSAVTKLETNNGTAFGLTVGNLMTNLYATGSRVAVFDSAKRLTNSTVTTTELGYLGGVSSALQTQIDEKVAILAGGASNLVVTNLILTNATASRVAVIGADSTVTNSTVTDSKLEEVSGMFGTSETEALAAEAAGIASWTRMSSTFSGWSTVIGSNQPAFKRIKLKINAFDAALIPSSARVRIRTVNSSGTILGDKTISVSPSLNTPYTATFDFDSTINNTNVLFVELFTNGRTGLYEVDSSGYPIANYAQARYSTDANVSSPGATAAFSGTTQAAMWFQLYSLGSPNVSTLSGDFKRALNSDSVLAQLFTFEYGFTESASVGSTVSASWVNNSSTFTGWGALCGPQQNFSAVRFYVYPWDTAITQVRAVVKQTDVNGTILADKTVSVTTEVGVPKLVTVDFGSTIANAGAAALFFEYHCNAKSGLYQLATTPYSGTVNYWTGTSVGNPGAPGTASARNFAVFFGDASDEVQSFTPTPALASALNVSPGAPAAASVKINLPATIYATEGIEKNLYFRDFIRGNVPLDSLDFDIVCAKGAQYGKFWRVTPEAADAASHNFQVRVFSGGALAAEKTCTLTIKAKSVGGGATRKILWIGDSLTANGKAIAEMKRIDSDGSLDSGLALTFVGTKTGNASDSVSGTQSYAHEAISGKTFSFFNSDPTSPFYFSGAFNFATYLSTNSISLSANDWVLINLGVNDVFSYTDDVNLSTGISAMKVILDAWITQIKAAVSGVRVGILLPIVSGNADSFGIGYGSGQTQWRYERNRQILVETFLSLYDGRQGESIYVFEFNGILDGENNFPTTATAVNALNTSVIFEAANNGVHPADSGYWQMGQAVFSFLKAQEN